MYIYPNYNLNYFRVNQKNEQPKSVPQYMKQPAFMMQQKVISPQGNNILATLFLGRMKSAEKIGARRGPQIQMKEAVTDSISKLLRKKQVTDSNIENISNSIINNAEITMLLTRIENAECRKDLELIENAILLLPANIQGVFNKNIIPQIKFKVANHAESIKDEIEYRSKHAKLETENNKEYINFVHVMNKICSDDSKQTDYAAMRKAAAKITNNDLRELVLKYISRYESNDKDPLKATVYRIYDEEKAWAPQADYSVEFTAKDLFKKDLNLAIREQIYDTRNKEVLNNFQRYGTGIQLKQNELNGIKQMIPKHVTPETFTNPDEAAKITYELIKQNQGLAKTLLNLRNIEGKQMYNYSDVAYIFSAVARRKVDIEGFFKENWTFNGNDERIIKNAKIHMCQFSELPATRYVFAPWNGLNT